MTNTIKLESAKISKFTATFLDKEVELKFLNDFKSDSSGMNATVCIIGSVVYLLSLISNYFNVDNTTVLITLFYIKFIASLCLFLVGLMVKQKGKRLSTDFWVVFGCLGLVFANTYTVFVRIENSQTVLLLSASFIFIFYNMLYIRARYLFILGILSAILVANAARLTQQNSEFITSIITLVILANVFGALGALTVRHNRRRIFFQRLLLSQEIKHGKILEKELLLLATTDSLTGANNRRRFFDLANTESQRVKRIDGKICIAMLDLDHFKSVNDNYGHHIGDTVLIEFSEKCLFILREVDLFARFGGEEFAVLLSEGDLESAYKVMERLRTSIAELRFTAKHEEFGVTTSIGLINYNPKQESIDAALSRADAALYEAKHSGRNRTVVQNH